MNPTAIFSGSGFKAGGDEFHLTTCDDETSPEIQEALGKCYREHAAVTCLCRPAAALPLEICFLREKNRYYLKRKSVFHPHSDSCFLNKRQSLSSQMQDAEFTSEIFEQSMPSTSAAHDVTKKDHGGTLDGESSHPIGTFGSMVSRLLARAYVNAALPSTDGDAQLFRNVTGQEIMASFEDQIAMARVEVKNGLTLTRTSSGLLEFAQRQDLNLIWGIANKLHFENSASGEFSHLTIDARKWKLPRFCLGLDFELSGVYKIFGVEVPGPYFFVGLAQTNGRTARLAKFFLHPLAGNEREMCPVDSATERRWLEGAWLRGRTVLKILSNRSIMPLLQRLPDRPALALAEGFRRNWRPDFIGLRAGRIVVIEIAGLGNHPGYMANLAEKEIFWRALAKRGDFDHEIQEPTADGGFKRMSSQPGRP
jgi:hypothetical protein